MTVAQLLLTIAVLGFALVTPVADLNRTHATNPLWTGHARLHVVWQVLSYVGIGAVTLWLVWGDSLTPPSVRMGTAAALCVCVYGGFFGAALSRGIYDGRLHDPNGYLPRILTVRGRQFRTDINVATFSALSLLLGVAIVFLLWGAQV